MDLRNRINILERRIVTEESDLRLRWSLVLGAVVVGLSAAALVYFLTGNTLSDYSKWVLGIAGLLITGTGTVSLNGLPGKRHKIIWIGFLRDEYETLYHSRVSPDPLRLEELNKLFGILFEKDVD